MKILQVPTINIKTWREFFAFATAIASHEGEWIFRGQQDSTWPLRSSFDRYSRTHLKNDEWSRVASKQRNVGMPFSDKLQAYLSLEGKCDEWEAIKQFNARVAHEFAFGEDWVSCLAVMQHYGFPTRLLDFTKSAFVALFFAFENNSANGSRAIFAINFSQLKKLVLERLRISAKNCDLENVLDLAKVEANKIIQANNQSDCGCGVLPIVNVVANPRLCAQQGFFLMSYGKKKFDESLCATLSCSTLKFADQNCVFSREDWDELSQNFLLKLVFDQELGKTSPRVLSQLNLTYQSLYQGWDTVARSISYRLLAKE